ncbi:unnamed protein product [Rhizoctonia solani]|uniref:Uncharacterized protein n=1 Tax=Rhizoctonia solani TaxID=456999 RepID=A0A8H3D3F3_9AGAM|nr:unnamed protein product [Rhizoctonia solani]
MADSTPPPRVMSPPPKRPTIDTTFTDSTPSQALDGSVIMDEPSELPSAEALKKSRRQTAIYPNTLRSTPKPFSRSAAKRESVMALGSIEHLQHYFTKTGLQAKQRPMIRGKGLVPAIGGKHGIGHVRAASSVTSIPELPPSPMVPMSTTRIPFVHLPKSYHVDPAQLKPGVIRDLKAVEQAWKITPEPSEGGITSEGPELAPTNEKFDVLDTLRITTHAIRTVRDYLVALPDDHPTHTGKGLGVYRSSAFSAPGTKKDPVVQMNLGVQSLASVLSATIPSSPGRSLSGGSQRVVSPTPSLTPGSVPGSPAKPRASLPATSSGVSTQPFPSRPEEPIALIRRAALEVLISLRSLEEKSRVQGAEDPSATPEASSSMLTAQDAHSASSRSGTPAFLSTSGDEADKESATSFPPSSQSQAQSLPRLKTPTGAATETVLVHGRGAVQVWSESDEEDFFADEPEKKEVWDERLVLGGGWLYRQDLSPSEMEEAKLAVGRYLDVVDAMIFRGGKGAGKRGWDRERRKGRKSELAASGAGGSETPAMSSVMSDSEDEVASRRVTEAMRYLSVLGEREMDQLVEEDEEGEDDEDGLPEWATVEPFGSDLIARANSLLRYLLPPHLVPCLPITPNRETLLAALSDGHLLCAAYNSGIRKSKKAWGFINAESIHETALATSEEKAAGSWTFRRRENLGLWAAALKLRYVIDIVPAEHSVAPTRHFHQAPQTETTHVQYAPNQFSPIVIAKHEAGWEDMLERAIWEWVNAVVTERKAVGQS